MRVETTITINRSVAEVMEYLIRVENLPSWAENVVEASQTSQGPVEQGATCRVVTEVMQRRLSHEFAVTEFLPGERYAAHSTDGPFPMSLAYDVKPFEGGAQLHSVSEFSLPGMTALVESVMGKRVQAQFESDHRELKRILES